MSYAAQETPGPGTGRLNRLLHRLTPSGSARGLGHYQSPSLSDLDADIEPPQFVSEFMRELEDVEPAYHHSVGRVKTLADAARRKSPAEGLKTIRRSASLLASPSTASRSSPTATAVAAAASSGTRARHSEDGGCTGADWAAGRGSKRSSVYTMDNSDRRPASTVPASNGNRSREALANLARSTSRSSASDLAEQASESSKTPGPTASSSASRGSGQRPGMTRYASDDGANPIAPTPATSSSLSHRTPGTAVLGAGTSESSKRFRSTFRLKNRDQQSTLRKPMRARADEPHRSEGGATSSPDADQPDDVSAEQQEQSPPDDYAKSSHAPSTLARQYGRQRTGATDTSLARAQLVEEDAEPLVRTRTSPEPPRNILRAAGALDSSSRTWADVQKSSFGTGVDRQWLPHQDDPTRSPSPPDIVETAASVPPRSAEAREVSQRKLMARARSPELRERPASALSAYRASPPPPRTIPVLPDQDENDVQPAKKRSFQTLEERVPLADLGARMNNVSLLDADAIDRKFNDYRVPIKSGSDSPPNAPLPAAPVVSVHSSTGYATTAPAATIALPEPINATGAAAVPKKTNHSVTVNGKTYLRSALLGKGGSSRVYRITDRDHNVFALKRVELGKGDLETYHSFCNEIELLKRLRGHDRIIQLVDSEVNEAKRTLVMVMEIGEIDLNLSLQERASARVSMNFIRYMWEQMLEAVKVVHDAGIVHTDLKPANFVLVKGALKLIDFGIAKAIPSDTTNIARDQQIGTANYMSPEALSDSGMGRGGERMMKMGRPSDIWSLGCILYQMVYGTTPFGHLRNLQQKMLAIQNPMHVIEFGAYAIPRSGGVENHALATPVEADLVKVLQSCLRFEPKRRATIPELLEDAFLRRETLAQQQHSDSGARTSPLGAELDPQLLASLVARVVRWSAGRQPTRTEQHLFSDQLFRQLSVEGL